MSFTPSIGPDGLATELPIISYTEKVLEEKELKLKQYIQDNYSKIRNVEKELATLALEVKLTAGPKKLALEHLRKKIEVATEKVKAAKLKEEQAKKVWQATEKVLQAEEAQKRSLCDDLNRLVQESAASQYTRLNDLSQRLEALNPELKGTASKLLGVDESNANSSQPSDPTKIEQAAHNNPVETVTVHATDARQEANGEADGSSPLVAKSDTADKRSILRGQHVPLGRGRGRISAGGQARGSLVLKGSRSNTAGGWTGAGFDMDNNS